MDDGSWPAAYVMQIKYANHPKVLHSKDVVLNVLGKGAVRYQVGVMKLNVSEPFT